jgi:hypothetical protein
MLSCNTQPQAKVVVAAHQEVVDEAAPEDPQHPNHLAIPTPPNVPQTLSSDSVSRNEIMFAQHMDEMRIST